MHSPRSTAARLVLALLLFAIAMPSQSASPASQPVGARPALPDDKQIAMALNKVRADPNLATEQKVRTLRWVDRSQPETSTAPAWTEWVLELFRWLAQSARIFVWVGAALLVALGAIYLVRLMRSRSPSLRQERFAVPTHVQDLDIRPESLPDNIGAAARTLWDSDEHRPALSLLYRGLLSRLVHVHGIPIRDSSTEGDCLALSASRLNEQRRDYVAQLIRTWLRAVYGGQPPDTRAFHALCDGFAAAMDAEGAIAQPPHRRRLQARADSELRAGSA